MSRSRDRAEHAGHTYEDQMLSDDCDKEFEMTSSQYDPRPGQDDAIGGDAREDMHDSDRVVLVNFTNEAEQTITAHVLPHCITFGRGAWWLEATDVETNLYLRIRMSKVHLFQKGS